MLNVKQLPTLWPVTCHTDHVGEGTTFITVQGSCENGVRYISKALAKGARSIVVDQQLPSAVLAAIERAGATVQLVPSARCSLSSLSAQAWGEPAKKLTIIGVTGTKGKTTTVFMVRHLLAEAGYAVAMLTGVYNQIGNNIFPSFLTTAHPDYLHMFFAQCIAAGVSHVVMEVSAQAMSLHRVDDITFEALLFTNFEAEHAEFYATVESYFAAKCAILKRCEEGAHVIVNSDSQWGKQFSFHCSNMLKVTTCGIQQCDKKFCIDTVIPLSLRIEEQPYFLPHFLGEFNAYNFLLALVCAQKFGVTKEICRAAAMTMPAVPGRMERYVLVNGATGIVDYAHTPGSFEEVLRTLRPQARHLYVVFGAGGGKDQYKRPLLGRTAAQYADHIFLTNDNPRDEDPQEIVNQIMVGVPLEKQDRVTVILDRGKAIQKAYTVSSEGDILVLFGKGTDVFQIVGAEKQFFSDSQQLQCFVIR